MNKSEISYIQDRLHILMCIYKGKIQNKYTVPAKKLTSEEKQELFLKALNQKILPLQENIACIISGRLSNPLDGLFDFSSYETKEEIDKISIDRECAELNAIIETTQNNCIFFPDKYPFPPTYEKLKKELDAQFTLGDDKE